VDEIIGWIAYDKIEPMPNDWAMHGSLCSLVAQLAGNSTLKPEDFMPSTPKDEVVPPKSTDSLIRNLLGG